jgi:DNA-binding GntR family transcriptional regulator
MASTTPKWRQIADEIAAKITDGTYAPDEQLPSVQALVSEGKGATATVHRAYQALEAEGLIRTTQGSGTTVLGREDTPQTVLTGRTTSTRALFSAPAQIRSLRNSSESTSTTRSCSEVGPSHREASPPCWPST